jgi:hypothetical protein
VTITFRIEKTGTTPRWMIRQEVTQKFVHDRWEIRGGGWLGQGPTVDRAILDWLAYRLGAKT